MNDIARQQLSIQVESMDLLNGQNKNGGTRLCRILGHGFMVRTKRFFYQCQILFQANRRGTRTYDEKFFNFSH